MTYQLDRANGNRIIMGDIRVTNDGELLQPPVRVFRMGVGAVTLGGPQAGWVSGDIRNVTGGLPGGSGFVAGAAVLTAGSITSIPVSAGGSGFPGTSRIKLNFTGDGTGAAGYVLTNGSGVVSSIVITNGGAGYTTVTAALPVSVAATAMVFDLGPDYDQYVSGTFIVGGIAGSFARIVIYGSFDGSTSDLNLTHMGGGSNSELYLESLSNSSTIARNFMLFGTRYVRLAVWNGMDTGPSPYAALAVRPS